MVPFHCGALLPTEQRNTSPQFRRVRRFHRTELGLHDGAELIAFVSLVGLRAAAYVFGWDETPAMFNAYRALTRNPPMVALAQHMIEANAAALDEETGEALLWAMKAGGFKRGRPPQVVVTTLHAYLRRGASVSDLAAHYGFTENQIQYWVSPPSKRYVSLPAARVHLAVG